MNVIRSCDLRGRIDRELYNVVGRASYAKSRKFDEYADMKRREELPVGKQPPVWRVLEAPVVNSDLRRQAEHCVYVYPRVKLDPFEISPDNSYDEESERYENSMDIGSPSDYDNLWDDVVKAYESSMDVLLYS